MVCRQRNGVLLMIKLSCGFCGDPELCIYLCVKISNDINPVPTPVMLTELLAGNRLHQRVSWSTFLRGRLSGNLYTMTDRLYSCLVSVLRYFNELRASLAEEVKYHSRTGQDQEPLPAERASHGKQWRCQMMPGCSRAGADHLVSQTRKWLIDPAFALIRWQGGSVMISAFSLWLCQYFLVKKYTHSDCNKEAS